MHLTKNNLSIPYEIRNKIEREMKASPADFELIGKGSN